jgi:hypothetical protein
MNGAAILGTMLTKVASINVETGYRDRKTPA